MKPCKAHNIYDRERTVDIDIEENVDFSKMFLKDEVLIGLNNAGFIRPSPIQLKAIPLGRCGLDLLVQAKSGTGKTCVFTVVALEMISVSSKALQVLVLAPTREIADQITMVINSIGSSIPKFKAYDFIGGTSLSKDETRLLTACHIAVGTPGRILHLIEKGSLKVDGLRLFILDEADQLLSGNFRDAITKISSFLPFNKQVMALSATYPDDVTIFIEKLMRSPFHVRLDRESPALLGVSQFVRILPYHPMAEHNHRTKYNELQIILKSITFNQCLVFTNSQMRAESICNKLQCSGWPVRFLSGAQAQNDRLKAFHDLCSYKCRILVSTDLSARGLDSEHVNLVINVDVPWEHSTYLHRVGRAGRFGSRGGAITLACEGEEDKLLRVISSLANVKIKLLTNNWSSKILSKDNANLDILEELNDDELSEWLEADKQKCALKRKKKMEIMELKPIIRNAPKESELSGAINDQKDVVSIDNSMNPNLKETKDVESISLTEVLSSIKFKPNYIPFTYEQILEECESNLKDLKPESNDQVKPFSIMESCPSDSQLEILANYIDNEKTGVKQRLEKFKNDSFLEFDALAALESTINCYDSKSDKNEIESIIPSENLNDHDENDSTEITSGVRKMQLDETVNDNTKNLINGLSEDSSKDLKQTNNLANKLNDVKYVPPINMNNSEITNQFKARFSAESTNFINKNNFQCTDANNKHIDNAFPKITKYCNGSGTMAVESSRSLNTLEGIADDSECLESHKIINTPNAIINNSSKMISSPKIVENPGDISADLLESLSINCIEENACSIIEPKQSANKIKLKKHSNKKDYNENTGYGMWTKVEEKQPKELPSEGYNEPKFNKFNGNDEFKELKNCGDYSSENESQNYSKVCRTSKNKSCDYFHMNAFEDNGNIQSSNYINNYGDGYMHHYSSYYNSCHKFINSAVKFSSMMEYAATLGKMSYRMSRDSNKNKIKRSNKKHSSDY